MKILLKIIQWPLYLYHICVLSLYNKFYQHTLQPYIIYIMKIVLQAFEELIITFICLVAGAFFESLVTTTVKQEC